MTITQARKHALPAIITLAILAALKLILGARVASEAHVTLTTYLWAYALSALTYAVLAYGIFMMSRVASLLAFVYFFWQASAAGLWTRGAAVLIVVITALLSTGVIATMRYHSKNNERPGGGVP